MSMDTISDNTSGDDTLRATFEATFRATPYEWHPRLFDRNSDGQAWPGQYRVYQTDVAWDAYRAGYEHAIAKAAATVAAMIISPTDIILCADTIDEAAARIRAMVKP